MTTKHTKGPWALSNRGTPTIRTADQKIRICYIEKADMGEDEQWECAASIVADHNAAAELDRLRDENEELKQRMKTRDVRISALEDGIEEVSRLRAVNKELVEALEKIVVDEENRAKNLRHREAWLPLKFSEERMAKAHAALARAKEEANEPR